MAENLKPELERRQGNRDAVAAYFRAHVNEWVNASALMDVGGTLAFRTRVSECRLRLGMYIENKQVRDFNLDGSLNVQSFYRYLKESPLGRSADVPDPAPKSRDLFSLRP